MRVMVDSNIIISAIVFKSSKMSDILIKINREYELCIACYVVEEVTRILTEKFKGAEKDIEEFFCAFPYTLIETKEDPGKPLVKVRDTKDYPIIYTAITEQIDILITGDKDFFDLKIDRPEILSPVEFIKRY